MASNPLGVSARQMLERLILGDTAPSVMAQLARGRLRAKIPQLERALTGRMRAHQRFPLAHLDDLDEAVDHVSAEIAERVRPVEQAIAHLDSIPGVGRRTAEVLVAEVGTGLGRFATAAHLASWAGMCPGNDESAGGRRSGKTRPGSPWLRRALVEAAQAAGRTKDTYPAAQYRRLAARRGKKKAVVAVGHTILVIAYHLLVRGRDYQNLAPGTSTTTTAPPSSDAWYDARKPSATPSSSSPASPNLQTLPGTGRDPFQTSSDQLRGPARPG